jgi:hypothetical protein
MALSRGLPAAVLLAVAAVLCVRGGAAAKAAAEAPAPGTRICLNTIMKVGAWPVTYLSHGAAAASSCQPPGALDVAADQPTRQVTGAGLCRTRRTTWRSV